MQFVVVNGLDLHDTEQETLVGDLPLGIQLAGSNDFFDLRLQLLVNILFQD